LRKAALVAQREAGILLINKAHFCSGLWVQNLFMSCYAWRPPG